MDTITPPGASPSLRVLLVEDSLDDAELLRLELLDQGYAAQITRVDSPEGLEAALDAGSWDVLLCDHHLPRMDALSALAIVQSRGCDLPFIIVSHVISEPSAVEAMRAGAHDFLFKDRLGRMGAVIEREVREAELRRERRTMQQQLLLADRLTSVGMLAAGIAHEINNPLAYVLGNLEFALGHCSPPHPVDETERTEIVQALTHAREGAERIRRTTRDLKVFCRSSAEDEGHTPINVREVMESSISMAWNEMRHRARLVRHFERAPRTLGDQNRLGQVFLNLLVNAAQSLPDGKADNNEIRVTIHGKLGKVLIEVQDTGCGMTPEQQRRVFEPFFTTKPRGVGSGIGLSICRSIVNDMGGSIEVESRVGYGTTFRVELPAHESTSVLTSRPPQLAPITVPRSRIMVIDDEPALCGVVRRLLRREHEVVTFFDAREALKALRDDSSFDVILCDIMMPHLSGIDFFHSLRKLDEELAARTVFMTGGVFNAPAQQFLATVTNPLLEKPFETVALHAAIAQALEQRAISGTWLTHDIQEAMSG